MSNDDALSVLSPAAARLVRSVLAADAAADADAFTALLRPDATFQLGNQPALTGHDAVRVAVQGLFDQLEGGVQHELRRVREVEGAVLYEAVVTYVRRADGRRVALEYANVLDHDGEHFTRYRIYIDPSPLFAP